MAQWLISHRQATASQKIMDVRPDPAKHTRDLSHLSIPGVNCWQIQNKGSTTLIG